MMRWLAMTTLLALLLFTLLVPRSAQADVESSSTWPMALFTGGVAAGVTIVAVPLIAEAMDDTDEHPLGAGFGLTAAGSLLGVGLGALIALAADDGDAFVALGMVLPPLLAIGGGIAGDAIAWQLGEDDEAGDATAWSLAAAPLVDTHAGLLGAAAVVGARF